MKKLLSSIILMSLCFSLSSTPSPLSTWTGEDWKILTQEQKQYLIFGYLCAAQAIIQYYANKDLQDIDQFLHPDETVNEIIISLDIFYSDKNNLPVPIYVSITIIRRVL